MSRLTVLCVAGEASGDRVLAPVVSHLIARGVRAVGIGGDACAEAGLDLVTHARAVAAHGLVEALPSLPAVLKAWRRLIRLVDMVDAAILVDFPEVNLRLLRRLSKPALYLAPPQAWAWRSHRARALRRAAWVGCLMPFEADWYRARGVAAECIGHPLADRSAPPRPETRSLALLPGSRQGTVERLLPLQLDAARRLQRRWPDLTVHVAAATTVDRAWVDEAFSRSGLSGRVHHDADPALAQASCALAGAGTATLHAALAGRPVVTMARLHPFTAAVARRLVRVEHVGLPNLILGRRAMPECVQSQCHPAALASALEPLLDAPAEWDAELAAVRRAVSRPDGLRRILKQLDGILPMS